MPDPLYLCISLDVEEEGLFSGKYASRNPPVTNIAYLEKLKPLLEEMELALTLFCAYAVFANENAWRKIASLAVAPQIEIGGHLHHWSTPPFTDTASGEPLRTHLLPQELFRQRLKNLLDLGEAKTGTPLTSFRMGRWDLKRAILPILAELGIKVDSSICPLRAFKAGANHFLAPASPYWVQTPAGTILEAPITQLSLIRGMEFLWSKLFNNNQRVLDCYHFFGALSANPVWHSLSVMKLATRRHFARGGRILNLFWHSSELMPGASPNIPDQASADRLLKKITDFCAWLRSNFNIIPVTATQISTLPVAADYPLMASPANGDW